jgi:endoglucanase
MLHAIRRRVVRACCLALLGVAVCVPAAANSESKAEWPEWKRFVERFVQADGRIIDLTFDGKSTSEGQSYGLFFALVANRPDQFATLLNWTSANLANGQLGEKLPGWLWGKRDDGTWGLKDANAASDADLWIAYSLLEAGRLWKEPRYEALGRRLLALIAKHEVVDAGKAGVLLLPGPVGFVLAGNRYRINPSYLPGFMFHYLEATDPKGPWGSIWRNYSRLEPKIYSHGVAPDLVVVDAQGKVTPDSERAPSGSYDAIRVYLWAGMSEESGQQSMRLLAPFRKIISEAGAPPEKINPETGVPLKADYSPMGYAGAVLPFLKSLDDDSAIVEQLRRINADALQAKLGHATNYYDQVLILFGKGWLDGYYRFDARGRVVPKWAR